MRRNVATRETVQDLYCDNSAERPEPSGLHPAEPIGAGRSNIRGANRVCKRAFDVLFSAILVVLSAPLMLLAALAIKLGSRGPVLFRQERIGEGGRRFLCLKFRTMREGAGDELHREYARRWIERGDAAETCSVGAIYKIRRDPRLTAAGALLRKFSLDELPQLFNVLRGEMSLIGPRPPIPYEVDVYRTWHRRRLEGPQGITGLWQVSGRNRLSFEEMVKLDIEYIENWSLALDLKILWRTVAVVLLDR
jgi:lipopolysaccharide/colanic/teichoic acid biosynthesis glycosyltransferase